MSNAIEFNSVTKRFGSVTALHELTMQVAVGDVHGFLGPNGAGKSTAIRVLLGLLRPTSGQARLLGGDPFRDAPELHRRIGYVPGDVNLWPNLSGGEAIDLLGRARGGLNLRKRDSLIERFNLDPRKRGRTYSKGNRQKVALIAALASDNEVLLLDEPTSGLDPLMERVFTEVIHEEVARGCTILLSSHILSEVEALCEHVSIIRDGHIVDSGTLDQLRHLHHTHVSATLADDAAAAARDFEIAGIYRVQITGQKWDADVDDDALPEVLQWLGHTGATSLTAAPASLEELFMRHYEVDSDASSPAKQVAR